MTVTITSTALESGMADALVTDLGANCELAFYNASDVEIGRCTGGTATKNTATSPDSVDITGLADDTSISTDTCSYATLETVSAGKEVLRFSAPVSDIGLATTTFVSGETLSVTSLSVTVPT